MKKSQDRKKEPRIKSQEPRAKTGRKNEKEPIINNQEPRRKGNPPYRLLS